MRKLAQAAVRHVLAGDRNPVLRLVEICYDPNVATEIQVQAAGMAAPYLFPKKSLEVTASVALDHPNAAAIIEQIQRRFSSYDQPKNVEPPAIDAEISP